MAKAATACDGLLGSFSLCLDPDSALKITRFQADEVVQQRVAELAERANEGLLTEDERSDYESFINVSDFIAILKLRASKRLNSNPA